MQAKFVPRAAENSDAHRGQEIRLSAGRFYLLQQDGLGPVRPAGRPAARGPAVAAIDGAEVEALGSHGQDAVQPLPRRAQVANAGQWAGTPRETEK